LRSICLYKRFEQCRYSRIRCREHRTVRTEPIKDALHTLVLSCVLQLGLGVVVYFGGLFSKSPRILARSCSASMKNCKMVRTLCSKHTTSSKTRTQTRHSKHDSMNASANSQSTQTRTLRD